MDAKGFSRDFDTILVFRKSDKFKHSPIRFTQNQEQFSFIDEKLQKRYRRRSWRKEGSGSRRQDRPNLFYGILAPDQTEIYPIKPDGTEGRWRGDKNHYNDLLDANLIEWVQSNNRWQVYVKQFFDEEATQPPSTVWLHEDFGNNHEAIEELKKIFGYAPFETPKPTRLLQKILQIACANSGIVMDSFAGSGSTGHAVLKQNAEDGGNRHFILVELDNNIATNITAMRLRRGSQGYTFRDQKSNEKHEPGLGSGFRYCELGPTLFDPSGQIRPEVSYADLAQHVYFIETGSPLSPPSSLGKGDVGLGPTNENGAGGLGPLLGIHNGTAVYLLYNGILKDKSLKGGNVLTAEVLAGLPAHAGPSVIYGTGCRLSPHRLIDLNIVFKQIPYEIREK